MVHRLCSLVVAVIPCFCQGIMYVGSVCSVIVICAERLGYRRWLLLQLLMLVVVVRQDGTTD